MRVYESFFSATTSGLSQGKTKISVCIGLLWTFVVADARAILIEFDYSYDTTSFFQEKKRRDVLNQAAHAFSGFTDALTAINPTKENTWSLTFDHPSKKKEPDSQDPEIVTLQDRSVPANTIIVYVGAMNLGATAGSVTLAESMPGGGGALSGSQEWDQIVRFRGQSHHPEDDFGPWGGSLTFNSNASINWYFGLDESGLAENQFDALTVATHEIAHILGFGEAPSWSQHLFDDPARFYGLNAENGYQQSSSVPVDADLSHWHESVGKHLMVASIPMGRRIALSALDRGGLCDAGWTHPECHSAPEPTFLMLCGMAMIGLICTRRWEASGQARRRPFHGLLRHGRS